MTNTYQSRRTFAIISHPDAGKTTLTEKLLLYGGAIQMAGTVKGRKASKHATSDWLELEKQRGISVTTSVMQFPYNNALINLLDTPGHADFSEDTYRTLTAVDSALMVIDAAKGVEPRTIKLMEVCRLRETPIMTFINKLDRESRSPIDLLDEIESILKIACSPITWPIGMGKAFRGIYHLYEQKIYLYQAGQNHAVGTCEVLDATDQVACQAALPEHWDLLMAEIELIRGVMPVFDQAAYLAGAQTPVFFGSAINNFGIRELLNDFVEYAPAPLSRSSHERLVEPSEDKLTGFVFKIQANMDPQHRDRIAFMRVVSGRYNKGMKLKHLRVGKTVQINNAMTFMAGQRDNTDEAFAGDILGLHNHGTIQIGDTFTEGESLKFTGIPNFAPELFRLVRLKDPLKQKALLKGLIQLSEEGATQVFRPIDRNDIVLGAVGVLQFDVVAYRLLSEYNVQCVYESVNVATARWVACDDKKRLTQFMNQQSRNLAYDGADQLTYLAPSRVNLDIVMDEWADIQFTATREH